MAIPLTLRVLRDGQLVATKEFHREIIKVGRLSSAHLCIDDERVSRIHAVIEVAGDGQVSVIDMGSVEGTFVNGKRISKAALANGDAIEIGATRLEIAIGAEAEAGAGDTTTTAPAAAAADEAPGEAEDTPAAAAAGTAAELPVASVVPQVPPEVLAAAQQAAAQVIAAAQAAAQNAAAAAVEPQAAAPAQAPAEPAPPVAAAAPQNVAQNVAQPAAPAATAAPAVAAAKPSPGTVAEAWAQPQIKIGRISLVRQPASTTHAPPPRPLPLPRSATDRALQLDVRFFWGDTQLAVGHFDEQTQVTVGAGVEADFQLDAAHLPGDAFPLLKRNDGSWTLAFNGSMDGEWISDAGPQRLSDLVKAGKVRPGEEPGFYELPLASHEAAWVDLGHIRADVCFRPTPKQAVVPWAQRLDYQFLNVFVVAAFLIGGLIVGAANSAYDADIWQDDLHSNEARWAKTLFEAPKRHYNPFFDKLSLKAPKDPGQMAAKAAGDEGQMGKRDAPKRNTRSAPRAIDPNDKEQVKNQGILAMLGKGKNAGLSTIFGTSGLGGDLKGAIGGITGNGVGDAHGFGGLGLKGTGTGGGGVGNTIGVGAVGTKGRGGGMGSFGSGVGGLGKKGSSDVQISSSEAVIVGYDKELVRKVVHSHHSQLKYCYESELVRQPNMSGKITVKWVIGSQGRVTQVSTVSSSLNNARVASCINARVKSWNFPAPKGGGIAVITYPFVFRPSGG
ncbi:AgmX/PglI C-terminal domain-containing protein [Vulgatibacter sp.]|uniref:AgmX/PglI C-terminal domain-containing protein n=1 Tax=Vulgatibacter sp. TaxID=1971226 RepID=UPI00356A11C8